MIADLLAPDDSRWQTFLARAPHDTYHLPEYARVCGQYERAEPVAFYAEEGTNALLMPLLVRELPPDLGAPNEWRDASSPYGYAGPITNLGMPADVVRRSLFALKNLARERGIVSAFVRLNPFRSVPTVLLSELGTVVNHGPVVYVDLCQSGDEWWAQTRGSHRDDIARLDRLGYSVEMDDWSAYAAFRALYGTTMRRLSASAYYQFSDAYFDELRELLGDHLHLCVVRGPAGDVAASGLFMITDRIVAYHLSGSSDVHLAKSPSKLMLHFARRWAKERGALLLNLGGGFGAKAGGLYHFKAGFSRSQVDFHTVRMVFDNDRYEQLTTANRQMRSVDTSPDAFFPWYRQSGDGVSA